MTGGTAPRDPARLHERRLSAGTVIFRQGDPGDDMFVVTAGRVRLTIGSGGHETVIGTLEAGAFFGEMTLLGGVPRSATAVAATDTTLLRIGRDVFAIMMQDDLEVVFRMLETIRGRLAASDERFETLAARIERARVIAELLRRALAGDDGFPVTGSVGDLESACGASTDAVAATLAALAGDRGLTVGEGRFTIAGPDGARRLAESLVRALARDRD